MKFFYCQYDDDIPRRRSSPGSRIHQTYVGMYDENGRIQLVPDKVINVYDQIQSWRDSCDLNVLIKRYLSGDTDALNKVQGVYGDFTKMPADYAALLNRISDGRRLFDGLRPEVKAEFGNSYEQFLVAMGHEDFLWRLNRAARVDDVSPVDKSVKEEGVTSES